MVPDRGTEENSVFDRTRRRPYRNWPRVKTVRGGGVLITGTCPTWSGWSFILRAGSMLVVASCVFLVAVATLGLWGPPAADITEGTSFFPWIRRVASVQWLLRDLLVDRYPDLGRAIGYRVPSPIDWHLGGLGLLLYAGRGPASHVVARLLALMAGPLCSKRIRVLITRDRVRFGGPLFGRTLRRDDNGTEPVRFRIVSAEEYFASTGGRDPQRGGAASEQGPVPPAIVEVTRGYRRYKLVFARRADQAEAIVDRCRHALLQTQPMLRDLP